MFLTIQWHLGMWIPPIVNKRNHRIYWNWNWNPNNCFRSYFEVNYSLLLSHNRNFQGNPIFRKGNRYLVPIPIRRWLVLGWNDIDIQWCPWRDAIPQCYRRAQRKEGEWEWGLILGNCQWRHPFVFWGELNPEWISTLWIVLQSWGCESIDCWSWCLQVRPKWLWMWRNW